MRTPADASLDAQHKELRAALYGRASQDRTRRGRSVNDQMIDCRRECSTRGWNIIGEYPDLDRSASRYAKRRREKYDQLVRDIEAGQIDVLVSWESSRVSRDLKTYVELRDLCLTHGVLWCYSGTIYDMRIAQDRMVTAFMAMQAESEADGMHNRSARTTRLSADRGTPHGKIPFGFARKYDSNDGRLLGQFPHAEHAEVVLDLFRRAAARESVRSLQRTLSQYVPDATTHGVSYLLKNRAYIGLRSHHGQDVKATWDAIVPEVLFWSVQEVMGEPGRRTTRDTRAVYLLSGIAMCAVCRDGAVDDEPVAGLRIVRPGARSGRSPRYFCRPDNHVGIATDRLDAYVEEHLLLWLKSPCAAAAFAQRDNLALDEARGRAAAIRAQLQDARSMAARFDEVTGMPHLSIASLSDMERRLSPLLARAEGELRRLSAVGDPVLDLLLADPDEAEGVWADLGMEQQRHAVRILLNVTLNKASSQGRRTLDDDRIRLVFLTEPGFQVRPTIRRPPVGA